MNRVDFPNYYLIYLALSLDGNKKPREKKTVHSFRREDRENEA